MSNRRDRIIDVVAEQFGVSRDSIKPETHLENDLAADSFDEVELVIALEEEFDTQISDEAAERCKTVGDIFNLIANVLD